MNTYGFHTIHGRAPTLATGLKLANPELQVWVVTGDGDALSIGGNHILHSMRRNVDIKVVMFNNRIYGLTKGQAFAHVASWARRPSRRPLGTVDIPLQPLSIALGRRGQLRRALGRHAHRAPPGDARARRPRTTARSSSRFSRTATSSTTARIATFTERDVRDDRMLVLEHGKPMIFGKDRDKGIRLNGLHPEVVTLGRTASRRRTCSSTTRRARIRTSPTCCRACGGRITRCPSACCAASTGPRTTS